MPSDHQQEFRLGPWQVEPAIGAITGPDGETRHLEPKVMDVLVLLAAHPNKLVSRNQLLDAVWNGHVAADELLTRAISELRRALHDDRGDPLFIETIPKRGYRLIGQVRPRDDPRLELNQSRPVSSTSFYIHKPAFVMITALVLALVYIAGSRFVAWPTREAAPATKKAQVKSIVETDGWENSIAVLPFVNMSGDSDNEYFSDGLTEDIQTRLARIPGLKVIGRTSSFSFKGKDEDLRVIGQTLGVTMVLKGSVRKSGGRVRVTAKLINTSDGSHIWGDSFDRNLTDTFAVQDDVTAAIIDALQIHISKPAEEQSLFARSDAQHADAEDLYYQARYFFFQFTLASNRKAQELYRKALEIDPNLAKAHAGIAVSLSLTRQLEPVPDALIAEQVEAHIARALVLDEESAEVWATYALFLLDNQRWEECYEALQRALDINPNNISANTWAWQYYQAVGPISKSVPYVEKLIRLDPINAFASTQKIYMYIHMREYEQALEASMATIDLEPTFWLTYWARAKAYDAMGDYSSMLAEINRAIDLRAPDESFDLWPDRARAYVGLGRMDDANAILAELQERSRNHHVPALDFARIHAAFGDDELVLISLEKGIESGHWKVPFAMRLFTFDGVRDTPRFKRLMDQLQLETDGYL